MGLAAIVAISVIIWDMKRRTIAAIHASRRRASAETKRLQGEVYYEMLARIQDWSERHKKPFSGVMLSVLAPWARRKGIKVPTIDDFSLEDQG